MLFAIIGSVLLAFALVALVVGSHPWLFWAHLGGGLALVAYAAATGMGELRNTLGRDAGRRGLRQGSNAVVQTVAIAVILGLVAYLSTRYPKHWDWTESGVHTLAEGTSNLLRQVGDREVGVYAFFSVGNQDAARKLLERYAYESDAISYQLIDANQRPDLATRFEIQSDGVLIVCEGSCETATSRARIAEASEQELTKAIRQVISEQRKIYFLTGHGEGAVDDEEASGYSRARLALEDENYAVEPLLLARLEEVPDDADAVVLAGPTHSLLDRELEALDRYLRRGGALAVLVDPLVVTRLEPQVLAWGVELGDDVIVDQQVQLFAGARLGVQPIVQTYGSHPITERMTRRPTLFQVARSLRAADGASPVALASTGNRSWAETDLELFSAQGRVGLDETTDRKGPIDLAMALTLPAEGEDAEEGRLVVFGDADFARNRYIHELFNADLFLNAINWLAGEEAFITIERKRPRASRAVMTPDQFANFRYLSLFVLPEAILLLGIFNWWRRRSVGP